MSIDRRDEKEGLHRAAGTLIARAAEAERRADRRLASAIDDFFLPDETRLDDRTRAAMAGVLGELTLSIETALRHHAARLLVSRALPELALPLAAAQESRGVPTMLDRLVSAGLMRDVDLMRELFGRVRHDLLAEALPLEGPEQQDRTSLLPRLAAQPDPIIASRAMALLAAENRRRISDRDALAAGTDLPAELHCRLIWWNAAALRERFLSQAGADAEALDRALADAALRNIAAHDEGERLEAAAMRLAAALDPRAEEMPSLLVEALADRRLSLFVALLGHALGLEFADAREIVLDPGADRLWLVLRALELDRVSIARIGFALSEADPSRDIERFADELDGIVAVAPLKARRALAPLMLHPDYRAALLALARGPVPRSQQ